MRSPVETLEPPAGTERVVLGPQVPGSWPGPTRTDRAAGWVRIPEPAVPGGHPTHTVDNTLAGLVLLADSEPARRRAALTWVARHVVPGGYVIAGASTAPPERRLAEAGFERMISTADFHVFERRWHPLLEGLRAKASHSIKPAIWHEARPVLAAFELDPDILDMNADNRIGVLKRGEQAWRRWLDGSEARVHGLDRFSQFVPTDGNTAFLQRLGQLHRAAGQPHFVYSAGAYSGYEWMRDLCALEPYELPPSMGPRELEALAAHLARVRGRAFAVVDYPQAIHGSADPRWLESLLDVLDHYDVPTYLDLALAGTTDELSVDASRPCVRGVLAGLGKAFGVWHLRASVAFMRDKSRFYEELGRWGCFSTLALELGRALMERFDPTELPRRHRFYQRLYCFANGVSAADSILLAVGDGARGFSHVPLRCERIQRLGIGDAVLEMRLRDDGIPLPRYLRGDRGYHRSVDAYEWTGDVSFPRLNAAYHAMWSSALGTTLRVRFWKHPVVRRMHRARQVLARRLRE